jgi:hypothetical protein
MFGFVIGAVCLIGLIKVLRHGRHGGCGGGWRGHGGGCGGHRHGGWGHHRGWDDRDGDRGGWGHRGGWGDRSEWFLRAVFERLDATPAQEKVIKSAVDEVREAGRAAKDELKKSRVDVAKAVRGPTIDEVFFGDLFARHDSAIESVRKAAIGAIAKVHDALDEKQRERLADLIEEGPRGFFRRGYR